MNKKLLVIGTLPETAGIGGVTIHVERLCKNLDAKGIDYDFCDYKKEGLLNQFIKIYNAKVAHTHVCNPILMFFQAIFSFICKTRLIITFHGNINSQSHYKYYFYKLSLKMCTVPILINSESYQTVMGWNSESILMGAFLPPIESEELLSDNYLSLIRKAKTKYKKVFSTNASNYVIDANGDEVYGILFLAKWFSTHKEYCLIFSDASGIYKEKYWSKFPENVIILSGSHSFYAVIRETDCVIRATSKDGDSLTIKEALYLGKDVICTDCVPRPEGVTHFHYDDMISFDNAVEKMNACNNTVKLTENCVIDKLIALYKKNL